MERRDTFCETIEERIRQYVQKHGLVHAGDSILAGVSGGADSVCLLFILLRLREYAGGNLNIGVVHVHHMLRERAADEDLAYVQGLCGQMKVPFYEVHCPVRQLASESGMSLEEAGRAARYDAFEKTAALHGYNKTAVAHHRDDQAETMLMNLFRGSGIHGMAGMRPQRGGIIRPLLCVSRAEIELYLNRRGIAYCTDASNYENMYTRNRLRNELLPYVKEHINRGAVEHIVRFGEQAEEIDCYFQKITKILFDKYGRMEQNAVILNVTCRQEEKLAVTFLIRYALERLGAGLRDIGTEHVDKIYQLLSGRTGAKLPLPGNISVEKSYEQLIFRHGDSRNTPAGLPAEVGYLEPEQSVRVEFGTLEFTFQVRKRKKNETFPKKKYTKWFDYDKIESMLQLRTRRTGDSIAVCADGGRKTLKKYFIDAKIPRDERESTVLLADGSEIVWIVGQRISERYKVHADTEWILEAVCAGMEDTAHT